MSKGIYLTLEIDDKGTAKIKNFGREYADSMNRVKRSTGVATSASAKLRKAFNGVGGALFSVKTAIVGLVGAAGMGLVARSFLDAANTAEQLKVRLKTLLGSVGEGNRMFQQMSDYAGSVPFELEEIMQAATSLAGVMKGGVDEISAWMPLIGDIAAAQGMSIQEVTSQVIRMYSAGAASADMFRERGVLAMLGFKSGVEYSVEETREIMFESWNKTDSQFKGSADELGKTWTGLMSMFRDVWFRFRNSVMDTEVFGILKTGAMTLLDEIKRFKKEGRLDEWAAITAQAMLDLSQVFLSLLTIVAKIPYAFGQVRLFFHDVKETALMLTASLREMTVTWAQSMVAQGTVFSSEAQDAYNKMNKAKEDATETTDELYGRLTEERQAIIDNNVALNKLTDGLEAGIEAGQRLVDNALERTNAHKIATEAVDEHTEALKEHTNAARKVEYKPADPTKEQQKFIKEYVKASGEVEERLKELSMTGLEYDLWRLDERIKGLREAGVEETKLKDLHEKEKAFIEEEWAEKGRKAQEKETKKLQKEWSHTAQDMRMSMKDLFLSATEGDFGDFFETIKNKLKNFLANIASSMATNIAGGILGTGGIFKDMPFGGGGSGGGFMSLFSGGGGGADWLGSLTGGQLGTASAAQAHSAGVQGPGLASGSFGGSIGMSGGAMALGGIGVLAMGGMMGYDYATKKSEENRQKRIKRGQEFVDSFDKWLDFEFESVYEMFTTMPSNLLSSKGLYAARKYAGFAVSEWAYTWQNAMKQIRTESMLTGKVSSTNIRLIGNALDKVIATSPAMRDKFKQMKEQINSAFKADVIKDFTDGIVSAETATSRLMRAGLTQLDAQTELFGEDYSDLMVTLGGTMPVIDETAELFNAMRESVSTLESAVAKLPEQFNGLKQAMQGVIYLITYFIDLSQAVVNLHEDLSRLPDLIDDLTDALASGDMRSAVRALNDMSTAATEAVTAFMQIGLIAGALGQQGLANFFALFAMGAANLAVALVIFEGILRVIGQINEETDLTIDKWDLWKYKLESMENPELVSSINDELHGWHNTIDEFNLGVIEYELRNIADEARRSGMALQEAFDRGLISQEKFATGMQTLSQATQIQIHEYIENLTKPFEKFQTDIKGIARELWLGKGERTSDVIWGDMAKPYQDMMAALEGGEYEDVLSNAQTLKSLIVERYQKEKKIIEDKYNAEIAAAVKISAAYKNLADNVSKQILALTTSGLNQRDIFERVGVQSDEVTRLRDLYEGAEGEDRAKYGGELAAALSTYLGMAEEAYQRPSLKYQEIYADVIQELRDIEADASAKAVSYEEKAEALDKERNAALRDLRMETIGKLLWLGGIVGTAQENIEGLGTHYLSEVTTTLGSLALESVTNSLHNGVVAAEAKAQTSQMATMNTTLSAIGLSLNTIATNTGLLGFLSLLGGGVPRASGVPYVPYDNYQIRAHKGERLLTASENRQLSMPINLNVDVKDGGKGSGKELVKELKHSIRYGALGNAIDERVRSVA